MKCNCGATNYCEKCKRLKIELYEIAEALERNYRQKCQYIIYLNYIINQYMSIIEMVNKHIPELNKIFAEIADYNLVNKKFDLKTGLDKKI